MKHFAPNNFQEKTIKKLPHYKQFILLISSYIYHDFIAERFPSNISIDESLKYEETVALDVNFVVNILHCQYGIEWFETSKLIVNFSFFCVKILKVFFSM